MAQLLNICFYFLISGVIISIFGKPISKITPLTDDSSNTNGKYLHHRNEEMNRITAGSGIERGITSNADFIKNMRIKNQNTRRFKRWIDSNLLIQTLYESQTRVRRRRIRHRPRENYEQVAGGVWG